jgi:hypothetical protein
MKFAWRNTTPDLATLNTDDIEEIDTSIIRDYIALLSDDNWQDDFDNNLDGSGGLIE